MEFSDKMGDSRPEGERNFWNGREAVTAKGGPYVAKKPKNELVTFIHVFKKKDIYAFKDTVLFYSQWTSVVLNTVNLYNFNVTVSLQPHCM